MSTKIKKIKGLIITLIIVAFIVLVVKGLHLLTKPVYTTDVLGQRDYDSHIKNSAVEINRDNFGTVQFVNGQYEFKFSGIKDLDIIGYLSIRKVVFGDLNGDIYKPDAAVIFTENRGGTGVIYVLGIVTSTQSGNKLIDWIKLGDRIDVRSLSVNDSNIIIERSTEDICGAVCASGEYKVVVYQLQDGKIKQIK